MSKEQQIAYAQMRILRLRMDTLLKEFNSIDRTPYKREVEDFKDALVALVDRACRNSGFVSKPIMVDRSSGTGAVPVESITSKGNVRSR
jgi:hypothetical protein